MLSHTSHLSFVLIGAVSYFVISCLMFVSPSNIFLLSVNIVGEICSRHPPRYLSIFYLFSYNSHSRYFIFFLIQTSRLFISFIFKLNFFFNVEDPWITLNVKGKVSFRVCSICYFVNQFSNFPVFVFFT